MTTVDLKAVISTQLKTLTNNVYPEKIVSSNFPYIVFKITDSINFSENKSNESTLELNLWDNISDTTRLENLCDQIITLLDNSIYTKNSRSIKIYNTRKQEMPDSDQNIRRRLLLFTIKS